MAKRSTSLMSTREGNRRGRPARRRRRARRGARRARRANPDTAVTVIGVVLGLAVLGGVVHAIRKRRTAPLVGAGIPMMAGRTPTWLEWRGWPWMWLAPQGARGGAIAGVRRRN